MKSCSSALATFLENATTIYRVDLYTISLPSGLTLRWTGGATPISASIQVNQVSAGPFTWQVGPPISDAGVQNARGVQPGAVDIAINAGDGRFTIAGVDVRDFAFALGFDGAMVRIDRAFAASAQAMSASGPVGTYCRFSGRYSELKELGASQVVLTCTDWRDCLQTEFPKVDFQTSCNNVFGDANCGVSLAALAVSGSVTGQTSQTVFNTSLTSKADGYFVLGTIAFTSGANAGLTRSVKASAKAGGGIVVSSPFPSPPAVGDAFTAAPGCPLSMSACQSWQGAVTGGTPWQQRFRATPFVPPPSTGLPT